MHAEKLANLYQIKYTYHMSFKEILMRLGLRRHAHEVYELLLKSKQPLLVAPMAAALGLARPEIYRSLAELLDKKFIKRVTMGKRTYYSAESPRRIDEEFQKVARNVSSAIERTAVKKEKLLPEHVRYFKGFSGLRAVFDDVIQHTPRKGTFYRYTSERNLEAVNRYLSPTYRKQRDQKKLERLVISNPVSGAQKRSRLERFIKYIPREIDLFDQNIIQLVYGNRLAFMNLNTEEAFIIEDKALADFQKVIFNQLFKKL